MRDLTDLRRELETLGRRPVLLKAWDPYILGATDTLAAEVLPAREAARRELVRCSEPRFPSLALAAADALFSKQRDYEVAVREATRPFAAAFAQLPLRDLLTIPAADVFRRTFGRDPHAGSELQHLSPEGRIRTIVDACRVFSSAATTTPEAARGVLGAHAHRTVLGKQLLRVFGLKGAMLQNICINVGLPTVKADIHVRRFIAPYLGLSVEAPAAAFEEALLAARPTLGLEPFEVDQIIWYTQHQPECTGASA